MNHTNCWMHDTKQNEYVVGMVVSHYGLVLYECMLALISQYLLIGPDQLHYKNANESIALFRCDWTGSSVSTPDLVSI